MKQLEYYKSLEYPERIDPDPEGGFVASIPDLPGCLAYGETKIKALNSLKQSKDLWLESYYESHGEAPEPKPLQQYSGKFLLRVPRYLHQRLDESAQEEGVSLNQYIVSLLSEKDSLHRVTRILQQNVVAVQPATTQASGAFTYLVEGVLGSSRTVSDADFWFTTNPSEHLHAGRGGLSIQEGGGQVGRVFTNA
ncbi:type II toxin-antitoxin system HicB family antitoxin [Acidobacteria bacterium AH-259-D05]|nr:type II toxin-antitoxin system HicB family antitoxin [Acidobacteria bacterium AH-259-D05]